MDEFRFDRLSRALGGVGSRRLAANVLASGAAVALLSRNSGDEAEAKKKKKRPKPQPCPVCPACPELTCPSGQIKVGGQCVTGQGTCAAGVSSCGVAIGLQTRCNNSRDCACLRSASGETRCGKAPNNLLCGQCTTDAQCAGFGTGAFCVLSTNSTVDTNCSCPTVGQGFCILPC